MAKRTLTATTPVGAFNRATASAYTHVNVWDSPRATAAFEAGRRGGVAGRWTKDCGWAVTWHGSEAAARRAGAGKYGYDHHATLLGTFPVNPE